MLWGRQASSASADSGPGSMGVALVLVSLSPVDLEGSLY